MAGLVKAMTEETFGQYLAWLRGDARPTDVARRIGFALTPQYIGQLEWKAKPGAIQSDTIVKLAQAHKDHPIYGGDFQKAFWDLWQRAGFPLPPGYQELRDEERQALAEPSTYRRQLQTMMLGLTSGISEAELQECLEDLERRRGQAD